MMAGKKNYAVVAVVAGLTSEQAARIEKEIVKAKRKYAPYYFRLSVRRGC